MLLRNRDINDLHEACEPYKTQIFRIDPLLHEALQDWGGLQWGRASWLAEDLHQLPLLMLSIRLSFHEKEHGHFQDLEQREQQYDVREHVAVFSTATDTKPIIEQALLYIASSNRETNPQYLGPASEEELALQISEAHGPSGPNSEYLFRLHDAIKEVITLCSAAFFIRNVWCVCVVKLLSWLLGPSRW